MTPPLLDPALSVELGYRACLALTSPADWDWGLDRVLLWPVGYSPLMWER